MAAANGSLVGRLSDAPSTPQPGGARGLGAEAFGELDELGATPIGLGGLAGNITTPGAGAEPGAAPGADPVHDATRRIAESFAQQRSESRRTSPSGGGLDSVLETPDRGSSRLGLDGFAAGGVDASRSSAAPPGGVLPPPRTPPPGDMRTELTRLREELEEQRQAHQKLKAQVYTEKSAVGDKTMGSLVVKLQQLEESAARDRQVLHELDHHLSEERNARVTVEDDVDSNMEKLAHQERHVERHVNEMERSIDHVSKEVSAMYDELTRMLQQRETQMRGEYEAEIRKVDNKCKVLQTENAHLQQELEQSRLRVARMEERLSASEDQQYEAAEQLKRDLEDRLGAFEARLGGVERMQAKVSAEQTDQTEAIHNCMDLLEHDCVTTRTLTETEARIGASIDRLGSGVETANAGASAAMDQITACREQLLGVERLATGAEDRAEELGIELAALRTSAEAAVDSLEADVAAQFEQLATSSGEFEDMVEQRLRQMKEGRGGTGGAAGGEEVEAVKREVEGLRSAVAEAGRKAKDDGRQMEALRAMMEEKMKALLAVVNTGSARSANAG